VPILGVERLVYGVDDLQKCSKFWDDFGLSKIEQNDDGSIFEVQTGSRVVVRRRDDCGVDEWFEGNGAKLAVWGVDTAESLDRLANNLARDRKVRQDDDGTIVAATDEGIPFGLKVWAKRPVISQPDPVNAPGNIQRFNQLRKWRSRAIPKALNHVVFATDDFFGTYEFYKERLGFRLSDHSRGIGAFLRGDGTYEHHTVLWANANGPVPTKPGYHHASFCVEDIDELMIGLNRMQELGWVKDTNKTGGLSRHRISSAMYCYISNPNGGEAEYLCDTDYLDDSWIPRVWGWQFGAVSWAHERPAMFGKMDENWSVELDPGGKSLEEYKKSRA